MSHIAIYIRSLRGGGAQRIALTVAGALARRGYRVDLVLDRKTGPYVSQIPEGVRVVNFGTRRFLRGVPSLLRYHRESRDFWPTIRSGVRPSTLGSAGAMLRYLRRERPDAMLSMLSWNNLLAIWAQQASGHPMRLVVSERNVLTPDLDLDGHPAPKDAAVPTLAGALYPEADEVATISAGCADDLAQVTGLDRERIRVVHNGFSPNILERAQEEPEHPWLAKGGDGGPPVILAVGRLTRQKDYPTLLRSFARLRTRRPARLLILGRGKEQAALETLARELDIAGDVDFAGFVDNPFAYYRCADLFVLSSAWEGFGNVLIEAMACGCPLVSTDCPGGPVEILEGGRFGPLVPVGDDAALAQAIAEVLDAPPDRDAMRVAAERFSEERMVTAYERFLIPQEQA